MIRLILLLSLSTAHAQLCVPSISSKTPVRGLYVSASNTIVGNTAKENQLLQFAVAHNFNYLMLYGVRTLLVTPSNPANPQYAINRQALGSFIRKAHEFYGLEVGVNVSSANAAMPILEFLDWPLIQFDPLMRYDALHYESEYWNGSESWASWSGTVSWLYDECTERGLLCELYVGNPTHDTGPNAPNPVGQAELDFMVTHSDRLQVTYYRDDPFTPNPNLYHDRLWRLHYLANAVGPARVVVLLNARPSGQPNMNQWLHQQVTPLAQRFFDPFRMWRDCPHGHLDNLNTDVDSLGLPLTNLQVLGYSWYRYQDLWHLTHPVLKRAARRARRAARRAERRERRAERSAAENTPF